jgi:hypothetical protein
MEVEADEGSKSGLPQNLSDTLEEYLNTPPLIGGNDNDSDDDNEDDGSDGDTDSSELWEWVLKLFCW